MSSHLLATLALMPLAPLAAVPAPTTIAPQGRLPAGVTPTAYRLDLTLLPENDSFEGHLEIEVTLKAPAKMVWINGRGLTVKKVVAQLPGIVGGRYSQVDSFGVAKIDFDRVLPAGRVTISIDYAAALGAGPGGAYHVKVADKWYSWSHFETIDARAAFPGFDQPGFKTPLTLSVTTSPANTVIANAPEIGAERVGSLVRHRFAPTEPLPTYLMAFYVGPFATAATSAPPTPQRPTPLPVRVVATLPNADRLAYALENTGPILALLEAYFGSFFPFAKLDQVASPIMQGGMENAGADLYGDQFLLVGADAPTGRKQLFGEVIAHELSHQWFGDLVTPAWWDDVWLNESFANWMGFRIGNAWKPELGISANASADAFTAMATDALLAGRPIHQPITTSGEIANSFDEITYGKGAQVVGMLAAFLGDDRFRDGVRLHLKRRAYGSATSEQFFRALADVAGDPTVVASLKSFVDQPGVPVVVVTRVPGGISLTQKPYVLLGSAAPTRSWFIPACLSIRGSRACTMVGATSATVSAKPGDVVMPNARGAGYYRFSLGRDDWDALIRDAGSLSPGEALATTDSLWAAFQAGEVPAALLLEEAVAISRNPFGNGATGPGRRLAQLRKSGFLGEGEVADFRRFVLATYAPLLRPLGFDPRPKVYSTESSDRRELRSQLVSLVAFEGRDTKTLGTLKAAAASYLEGAQDALDQGYLGTGLHAYLQGASIDDASRLLESALSSSDGFFRAQAIDALTGAGRMDIARLMESHFDDVRLQPTERLAYITGLFGEEPTRRFGLDILVTHFQELARNAPAFMAAGLLSAVGRSCSAEEASNSWTRLHPLIVEDKISDLPLARAVERSRSCAILKAKRSASVAEALQARVTP